VQVKEGSRWVETLLSLKRVPELRQHVHNRALILSSTVTVGRIAADPQIQQAYTALAMGAGLIGSVQIRNVATVGREVSTKTSTSDRCPASLEGIDSTNLKP
jgi:CO/xanthine dehydrogenase FAD-binding subunit